MNSRRHSASASTPASPPALALALALACASAFRAIPLRAQSPVAARPYSIVASARFPGAGGIDYVSADSAGRRLYVPRGTEVLVFDLDTLKAAGRIPDVRAHGVAIDPVSHHAFASSSPVAMWDSQTLDKIKSIEVQGRPDGIIFEPLTERIYVLSHAAPNLTVIDAKDGSVVGAIDIGGAPEQAASDGAGHLYVDIEDKDAIAVVDVKALRVTATYGLGGRGGTPAGLAIDAKNHLLFAFCRKPQTCVILGTDDGRVVATLPIGRGTDGGGFNPHTMEAFSSQGDGTLTIIRENSPTDFAVTQTVQTKDRAKTCTLDTLTDRIVLITTEPLPGKSPSAQPAVAPEPAAAPAAAPAAEASAASPPPAPESRGGRKGNNGPSILDLLVVGR